MSQATKLKDANEQEERFSLAVFRDAARAFRPAFKGETGPIVLSLILTIAVIAVDLLKPWPMKFIFDEVLVQERGSPSLMNLTLAQLVVLAAVAFVCIAVVCGWLTARATVAVSQIEKRVTVRIRRQVFEHLHRLAFPFHQSARTGDLLQRLMGDVAGVRRLIFSGWVSLIERVVVVGSTAVVMFVLDPWFASLALLPLPFHGVAISRFSARLKHFTHRQRKRESNASSVATESFQQIRLVKAYAAEDRATDHFTREADTAEEEAVAVSRMGAHMGLFTDVVNALGVGSVLLVGALRVLDGALTPGELLVLVTYARSLYRPVGKMSTDGGRLATASVSAERLLHVLKIPPEDPGRGLPAPRFHGDVSFEDVHYQHPDGVKALKGVSFTIPQGTLALMEGPNGAGKSTSLSLILRLITPQKGRLLIDGHPAEEFQLDSYRRNFAYVPQDTHLFAASIRENLLYGRPDASDEEIEQAARDALLDDVVERLPHGWDEVLGESGTTLSGGEARRLMLARAALRDARILLFDEPLTGLDPAARTTVARAIRRIAAGRTALVVSHGQASELEPDVTIRLEEGRCVAERQSQPLLTLGSSGMFRPGREVAQFLDDRSALALFRQAGLEVYSVERDFTRVRPNPMEGDVVSFFFRGRGIDGQEIELPGYVRISKNGAAEELAEWMDMPCESTPLGPGVRLLPGGRAGLFLFPNDRLLPGLNACANQEQLEEALDELEELNADGWRLKRNESVFIPKR
ncbi:MAG TPA: ABC transporter ATP-binding protein [Gemmatimonadales bacterium]|nr:ABC transporter ATP-binding protein [Gemmatimonadales bacterium]